MTATCALCGFRDASTTTDYDYEDHRGVREVPACGVCLEPPSVPPEWTYEPTSDIQAPMVAYGKPSRASILAVIAEMGEATAGEIATRLGIPKGFKGYSSITTFLMRMRRDGEVTAKPGSSPGGHHGALVYREGTKRVRAYIPQRPRGEVVLLFNQGCSAQQIARELGMNPPAVRSAICAARKRGELKEAA